MKTSRIWNRVVLDTCAITAESQDLESADFRLLLSQAPRFGFAITVPEVVVDEFCGSLERDLHRMYASLEKAAKVIDDRAKLSYVRVAPTLEPDRLALALEMHRKHVLETLCPTDFHKLSYPAATHQEIMDRLVKRLKPFSSNRAGYGDTLIWMSIVELLQREEGNVYFITDNHTDFCVSDEDRGIHLDLQRDLASLGVSESRIEIIPSIKKFIEVHVNPHLDKLSEIANEVRTGKLGGADLEPRLREAVVLEILDALEHPQAPPLGFPKSLWNISNFNISSLGNIDGVQAVAIDDRDMAIRFRVVAIVSLQGFTQAGSFISDEMTGKEDDGVVSVGWFDRALEFEISAAVSRKNLRKIHWMKAKMVPRYEVDSEGSNMAQAFIQQAVDHVFREHRFSPATQDSDVAEN